MKTLFTLVAVLFLSLLSINAQTIDVVTGLNRPKKMLIIGNDLYFSESTEVFKIDITDSSPVPVSVVSGLVSANGLAMDGTILYIAEFDLGRISKIDVSDPSATLETFVSGLGFPNFLKISENFLYYSDNLYTSLARIDLTSPTPSPEVIFQPTVRSNPAGMAFQGNILYFAQNVANSVSKIDVTDITTPIDVVVGLDRPTGICLAGNLLFISEYFGNKISTKDISDGGSTATDLVTGLNGPSDVAISGRTLYITETDAHKIVKIENVLGIDEVALPNNITLFPNPSSDFMEVSNLLEASDYIIYSINGSEVGKGTLAPKSRINITTLSNGPYFLRMDNGIAIKFIKD